jgi:hypothetical protein
MSKGESPSKTDKDEVRHGGVEETEERKTGCVCPGCEALVLIPEAPGSDRFGGFSFIL